MRTHTLYMLEPAPGRVWSTLVDTAVGGKSLVEEEMKKQSRMLGVMVKDTSAGM